MSTVTEAGQRRTETTTDSAPGLLLGNPVLSVVVIAGTLVSAWMVNFGVRNNPTKFMDLSVYRLGVKAWLDGRNIYGQLPASAFGNHLPFIYPPFAAVPFAPMAWLSWDVVYWLSTVLSVGALALVIYLVARRAWPSAGWRGSVVATSVLLPVSLVLQPITDTLWFGQVNILLMALVAADLLVEKPRWPRGVLIGVAAAVKLTPAGFVLIFLLRKDFRSTANVVLGGLVATVIGFAVNWSGSMHFWFGDNALTRTAEACSANNQTIHAALGRMNLPGPTATVLWVVAAALVAGLVITGVRHELRSGRPDAMAMAMVLVSALLLTVSPTAWGHHWVWVIPALTVMLGRASRSAGWALAAATTALVFWVRPFTWTPPHSPVFWWQAFSAPPQLEGNDRRQYWTFAEHVYGNLYVLTTVTLLALLAWRRRGRTRQPAAA